MCLSVFLPCTVEDFKSQCLLVEGFMFGLFYVHLFTYYANVALNYVCMHVYMYI